jgi:beta-phosphoglucomutase-like phosphatase (HAD superfamily)
MPNHQPTSRPAILFDLDGTLLDSNYQHILAWQEALREDGIHVPNARIHRCVGMSGGLMLQTLFTELDRKVSARRMERLGKLHKKDLKKNYPLSRCCPALGNCCDIFPASAFVGRSPRAATRKQSKR